MRPAQRLNGMTQSVIREMTRLALAYNAINLSQGFPDFAAPAPVKEAAVRAVEADYNQYTVTWGLPALRRAIADKVKRRYGMLVDPEVHVTVTCGVTEALLATFMAICDPGDEVIILEPFHEGFPPAAMFAGARPIFVPLEPPAFQIDPDRLRQAFSPRTKAILINTPHNPTGRVFSREELTAVAELCQEYDILAITDEIYEHIVYEGQHIPMATLPGMADRTITLGGFGKTFAVTGWRLGYALAPEPWSAALRTIHDFTSICAPVPCQVAAVDALSLPERYYVDLRAAYLERRTHMMAILDENGFNAQPPQGAYYIMADFTGIGFDGDDDKFARWLVKEAGVAVVPGSNFYCTPGLGKNQVRFAYPKRLETLDAAAERLRVGLKKLRVAA